MVGTLRKYLRPVRWLLKHGHEAAPQRSRVMQLFDMYRFQELGYLPSYYYYWKLYNGIGIEELGGWVLQGEAHQFSLAVTASAKPEVLEPFLDKRAFEAFCQAESLPSIRILASVTGDTSWGDFERNFSVLQRDLFAKPAKGFQGQGAMKFVWDGERHRDVADKAFEPNALWSWLETAVAKSGPYILQPAIQNHASLEELSGGSLVCVRALTHSVGTSARLVLAMMAMPAGDSHVSNFTHDDALGAPVDRVEGVLGPATAKARSASPGLTHHPATGAPIAGRTLPFWNELTALVTRAHSALPGVPLIGWDVAICPEGPLLIEGNLDMGVESLQLVHGAPLSDFLPFRSIKASF